MSKTRITRILCLILALASIFILLLLSRDRLGVPYSQCVVKSDEFNALMEGRQAAEGLFDRITMDDQELFCDSSDGFYLYSLTEGEESSFNPSVRIDSLKSGLKIAFCEKELSKDLISENGSVDFIVYDRNSFEACTLKFTTLPVMNINTADTVTGLLTRDDVSMSMKLYDNTPGVTDRVAVSEGLLHRRGNSSFFNPKGSYKLSLTRKSSVSGKHSNSLSLLGMPADDDWILNSMYLDNERIRDVFCTNLWSDSFGTDNSDRINLGSEFKYVEVFINNRYEGIYALGYKLRGGDLGASDSSGKRSLLYNEDQLPGTPYYVDRFGNVNNFTVLSGQESASYSGLRDFFLKAYESRGDKDALYSIVDVDNVADYFLYINFVQGMDNTLWNQYLLLDSSDDISRMLYAPWDMDYTFGRSYYAESIEAESYALSPEDMFLVNYGVIGDVIGCDEEAFTALLKEKYSNVRSTLWSDDKIDELINGYEEEIFSSGAFLRESARWQNVTVDDNTARLSRFRDYVHERLAAMDRFVEEPDYELSTDDYSLTFGMAESYNAAYDMFDNTDEIRLLQIKDLNMWDYTHYMETMLSFGIPEEYIKVDGSLRDQLCSFGEDAYYWSIPENTDLVAITGGDFPVCSENFFSGGVGIELSKGTLSYNLTDDGSEELLLNGGAIYRQEAPTDDYCLRVFRIDPETMAVTSVDMW